MTIVLTEDMDSGWERLGGQMFRRRRRVLSVLLLIYILWCAVFVQYYTGEFIFEIELTQSELKSKDNFICLHFLCIEPFFAFLIRFTVVYLHVICNCKSPHLIVNPSLNDQSQSSRPWFLKFLWLCIFKKIIYIYFIGTELKIYSI